MKWEGALYAGHSRAERNQNLKGGRKRQLYMILDGEEMEDKAGRGHGDDERRGDEWREGIVGNRYSVQRKGRVFCQKQISKLCFSLFDCSTYTKLLGIVTLYLC